MFMAVTVQPKSGLFSASLDSVKYSMILFYNYSVLWGWKRRSAIGCTSAVGQTRTRNSTRTKVISVLYEFQIGGSGKAMNNAQSGCYPPPAGVGGGKTGEFLNDFIFLTGDQYVLFALTQKGPKRSSLPKGG